MSHTQHERSGGFQPSAIEFANGIMGCTPQFRRFAKRYHRREARRESRRIIDGAITILSAEADWRCRSCERYIEEEEPGPYCRQCGWYWADAAAFDTWDWPDDLGHVEAEETPDTHEPDWYPQDPFWDEEFGPTY